MDIEKIPHDFQKVILPKSAIKYTYIPIVYVFWILQKYLILNLLDTFVVYLQEIHYLS